MHMRSEAESISLVQDASHGWLAMRFGSCDAKLHALQGMLGVGRLADLKQCHALKLRECTVSILQEFCSPKATMPFSSKHRKPSCKT